MRRSIGVFFPTRNLAPLKETTVHSLILLVFISLVKPIFSAQPEEDHHTSFLFDRFNGTDLILEADATVIRPKSVIALTNHSRFIMGRALYSTPVQMKSNEKLSSFSTTFVFSMVPRPHSELGGMGMAFILTPAYNNISPMNNSTLSAEHLALLNSTSNRRRSYDHFFGVEFDTIKNAEFDDPDDNHVGVDIHSYLSVNAPEPAGYWKGEEFRGVSLKSGRNIQAWIDYNALHGQLNVTITLAGLPRPQKPLISQKIDLQTVLQDKMFVGFEAATGDTVQDHYVLAWSFTTEGTAAALDISRIPSFSNMYSKSQSLRFIASVTVAALVLFSLVVVAGVFFRRAKYTETIEEWEQEFWPHRFTYKDLSIATNGFREENVLGYGGFGKVYRGILPGNSQEVAVKCITKEFKEGIKGFVAEITTMGRLQHRNLVPLRGWCRRKKKLFIVYDYMPNLSLDKLIFGNPTTILPWAQRYAILKGVAAGLLYLHEEWEKRVIHRDVKSSNVLLDSEFNGRLGDFGLARLYDLSENPKTSHVVGTLGYIAPELIYTGKAAPSLDVFSFGALLLEVACGRKPVDLTKDAEEIILTEWVWELYTKGRLLDAADTNLGKDYDTEEMERVLKLGFLCSHPVPESRLGMRHVCQILEGEAPLPDVRSAWNNIMGIMGQSPRNFFRFTADEILVEMSSKSQSEGRPVIKTADINSRLVIKSAHVNSPSLKHASDQWAIQLS